MSDTEVSSESPRTTEEQLIEAIQDVVLDRAFFEAQDEIFAECMPRFDFESEENKLEYTTMHQSYVSTSM